MPLQFREDNIVYGSIIYGEIGNNEMILNFFASQMASTARDSRQFTGLLELP